MKLAPDLHDLVDEMNRIPWTYVGVLTTKDFHGPDRLEDRVQKWIRRLHGTNQRKVMVLYVIERSPTGRNHVHVQIANIDLPPQSILDLWESSGGGFKNVMLPYNPNLGSRYALKDWNTSTHKGLNFSQREFETLTTSPIGDSE